MIYHPDIDGRPASMPIPFHRGKDLKPGILQALIRRFDLPPPIFG